MYSIIFEKRALESLNKLDSQIKQRIWDKIQQCRENPFRYLKHLEEMPGFKLRVGDYRIIIDINISKNALIILKVGHRKNVYEE
jgi:mRNA interferase RelE/StbE